MNTSWFLLLLPLLSALIIHFALKQRLATLASYYGTAATGAAFALAITLLGKTDSPSFEWISIGENFSIDIGLKLDKLSTGMMIVVTGIGLLVHLFSLGYMKDDAAKARYFGNLSLFMFSMTGIVLADNFLMMFIFWELVGLSSFLLIGHWYQKDSAADAAKKAFLTNRIGDFGFMIGILMIWSFSGSFVFDQISSGLAASTIHTCWLSIAVLLVFCGAIGKSAQAPLHVWLPDAMEGPTPVSALIHAATMVAAGVYMMARFFFAIGTENLDGLWAMNTITWIGGITSLLAALMATQQNDIKKILAYSTLSQLGYMVMAVGLAAPDAGMFHLFTHAWFKALLFLGSGAVIYACHHEQDIWQMGGLLKKMPITGITFIIGTLALTAVPFTSGFFSKEGILHAAHEAHSPFLWVAVGVAALTTFYMFRLIFVAFLGEPRSENAKKAKEVGLVMWLPLVLLAGMAIGSPYVGSIIPSSEDFKPVTEVHPEDALFWYSISAFVVGLAAACVFYLGKKKEPLNIPLFANKFYIDELYAGVVKFAQDLLAAVVHFFDEFIIHGLFVGGLTRSVQGLGHSFRRYIQSGNLQAYALVLGLGTVLVIYFTAFF